MKLHLLYPFIALLVFFSFEIEANEIIEYQNEIAVYSDNEINIEPSQILIYRDELGSANIESVRNASLSNYLRLNEMNFFDQDKTHWAFFTLENQTDAPFDFVLEGGRNARETYYIISNDEVQERKTGYFVPIKERDIEQNYLNRINLSLPANSTVGVYVKVESLDNLPLDFENFKLISKDTWNQSVLQINLFQGIFSGVMIILILLALFFYARTKSRVFLNLTLYALCNLIYFANVHGHVEIYFLRSAANAVPPLWLFPFLTSAAYLQFARDYNESAESFPKWDKLFKNLAITCVILFALFSVYLVLTNDYFIAINTMQIFLLAMVVLGLAFLFHIYQTGNTINKYFVYGSIFLLFSVVISIVGQFFYITNTIPFFVQFGLIIEILIFSFGLSYKAKLEYQEHDITQRSLIIQLQKNDKLKENINNKLREEVAERTQEIRQKNIELSVAKDEAEKATASKSEFLSVMSHEIRTPLNAIISLSHIMELDNKDQNITEYIDALKFSTENLHSLINDVLDYNKIEANKLKLESIEFSLIDTLRNISEIFKYKAKRKGIELRIEIGEHTPDRLLGDPTRLTQIFNNLLSNAIKFTSEGHVTLKVFLAGVKDDKAIIQFEVIDTGIGIPSDKIETIFNEFEQASNSTTREFGGTGLGLSITQKLLDLMDSNIEVDKEREEGTKFSFKIPFVINKSFNIFSLGELHLERNLKDAKVLVVDDNDMNRLVLNRLFTIWQADFTEASSGQQALNYCEKTKFDLILMDIEMRPMNGFEAVRAIIQDSELNSNTPIIAMSAYQTEDFDQGIENSGFRNFVHKPFDPDELYEKIIQHLAQENVE